MKNILKEKGLQIHKKYSGRHIPPGTKMVIKGALASANNPELRAARRRGIPVLNMPQFIQSHILKSRQRIVVTGTNGKTTTTTMLAWILRHAGKTPDYLFAGLSPQFNSPVRFRGSRVVVLEGDEYPAAKDDKRPKFLLYNPTTLLITNIAFDHAEIYHDLGEIMLHFEDLVSSLPKNGLLIIPDTCSNASIIAEKSPAKVVRIGSTRHANVQITRARTNKRGMSFDIAGTKFKIPAFGMMNVMNAAMAAQAAMALGVTLKQSAHALLQYQGIAGRMETLVDEAGATLIIDESYHPAAIAENIATLRKRFPHRRLVVSLQARNTGGRNGYQIKALPKVLSKADRVILTGWFDPIEFPGGKFTNALLAKRLRNRGVKVHQLHHLFGLRKFISRIWEPEDVLVCFLQPGCKMITDPLAEKIRSLVSVR